MKYRPEDLHLKTTTEILIEFFGVQAKDITKRQLNEVGKAMRNLNFFIHVKRVNKTIAKCWCSPELF